MKMIDDFRLLEKNNFKLIPYDVAKSKKDAVSKAKKMGYPVAIKIISSDIAHKTDVGGVKINIKNEESLSLAYDEIIFNSKGHVIDGVLIQKMARKGLELIIGGKCDPQFGHMIVLGLGGIYVEVFRDITARLCPITKEDVVEMVYELKAHPLIMGTRGQKAINFKSLEILLFKTCRFMAKENIQEIDLNPVIFDSKGCDIVDIRFRK
ncbi:MAG: acetate--CoA ligase family protein [Candidatus Micrarchaeia archaeon]